MLNLNKIERESFKFYSKEINRVLGVRGVDFNKFIISVNDPKIESSIRKEQGIIYIWL